MKNKIKCVLAFLLGAAAGVAASWKVLKTKYEQIANEEIESVKKTFSKRKIESSETDILSTKHGNEKPGIKEFYKSMITDQGYDSQEGKGVEKPVKDDAPYVIVPEAFSEIEEYDTVSLTYYDDGVLADEDDNIIEDVEDMVGVDSLTHFGEYEDDSVYVRNDRYKCDYEILRDQRKYADVKKFTSSYEVEG